MHYVPPNRLNGHDLTPLLIPRNRSLAWINGTDQDPYHPSNVARFAYLDTAARVPRHYQTATVTVPEVHAWIDTLVAEALAAQAERNGVVASITHGPSLLLLGPTGVGKTHTAYGTVRELAVSGVNARWMATTAADLYAAVRSRPGVDSESEFRRYRDVPLLLLDDLGASRTLTEFTEEVIFRLINRRYEHHLPTLITSNLGGADLASRLGDRVASRLAQMCQRITLKGADQRRRRSEAA